MTIYLIVAMYQGIYDGIEFASLDRDKAMLEYRGLVRAALGLRAEGLSWDETENMYENELEHSAKIQGYHIDQMEVT